MKPTCFQMYYQPIYTYIKRLSELAIDNQGAVLFTSATLSGSLQALERILHVEFFGIPNILLAVVILTVFIDAYYGVRKSVKMSKDALEKSKTEENIFEKRRLLAIHRVKKFQPVKLQFTFFKCFTLLGYLYFAKTLLSADPEGLLGGVLGFTSGLILKAPLAIFWYYDFKSIGNNSEYVYGKKAPIFKIVESIMEIRIKNINSDKN